jgi:cytochrome oxidase assembly protein ShyY1
MRWRLRIVPLLVTLALVALAIALANWQERRAAGKLALQQRLDERARQAPLTLDGTPPPADALAYRRVRLAGVFEPHWTVYLDNRPHGGQAGLYVLTPFRLQGSGARVLVARGWLPRDPLQRTRIVPYATPAGTVTIDGIAVPSVGRVLELGPAPPLGPGAIVQNAGPEALARASGQAFLPFMVEQTGAGTDALVRDWPRPDLNIDRNRGYAVQWYALAAMAALFFIVTGFRRARTPRNDSRPRHPDR